MQPPFHLAFPVRDLDSTRRFYVDLLGCAEGRSAERWVDFDFFGHQISAHVSAPTDAMATNGVDGDQVPTRHFGVILDWDAFELLRAKLEAAQTRFRIAPRVRFAGEVGEQATMFLDDPSGNALEFKAFRDKRQIFGR
jgi:hypothetical protein